MSFEILDLPDDDDTKERSGHIGVYWNGNIVVWGGFTDVFLEDWHISVEQYYEGSELWMLDIESCTWRKFVTSGDIPPSLSGSCAACSDDELYLFAGHGGQGPTSKMYMLSLRTMIWKDLTSIINKHTAIPSCRDKLCCWQHNELIIYFGGYGTPPLSSNSNGVQSYGEFVDNTVDNFGDDRGWNNNILIFDTINVKWIQKKIEGHGPSPRAALAAAKLGSKAYIFGGRFMARRLNDLHYLDVDSWQWSGSLTTTAIGCIPEGRTWHSLTPISNKHLLLFGGFNNERQPLGDAYILDTQILTWTSITPTKNIARMWHTACPTSLPGEVIIFGGCESSLLEVEFPEHSDTIIIFRYTALPLQRLCTDVVLKYYHHLLQGKLESETGLLVKSLIPPTRLRKALLCE